jgi:hypothetical protein
MYGRMMGYFSPISRSSAEPCALDAIRSVESCWALHGYAPKIIHRETGAVEMAGEIDHRLPIGAAWIDGEMIQLLAHQLVDLGAECQKRNFSADHHC